MSAIQQVSQLSTDNLDEVSDAFHKKDTTYSLDKDRTLADDIINRMTFTSQV